MEILTSANNSHTLLACRVQSALAQLSFTFIGILLEALSEDSKIL